MIKICPECLTICTQNSICELCGFPFTKKIFGRIEDFQFYETIGQINTGKYQSAKLYLEEQIAKSSDKRLSILKEKLEIVITKFNEGERIYQDTLNYINKKDFSSAKSLIREAIKIFKTPKFDEIKNSIEEALELDTRNNQAEIFVNKAKLSFQNENYSEAINFINEAVQLCPKNKEYLQLNIQYINDYIKSQTILIEKYIAEKDIKSAKLIFNTIEEYSEDPRILKLKKQVEIIKHGLKKKIILFFSATIILISLVGAYLYQDYDKGKLERNYWDQTDSINNKTAYQDYLLKYPTGKHTQIASKKIDDIEIKDSTLWGIFKQQNNLKSAKNYLNQMTTLGGLHLNEAEAIVDSIDYLNIRDSVDYFSLHNYIFTHPNSPYNTKINLKIRSDIDSYELESLIKYFNEYNNYYSQKYIDSILNYYNPVTKHFGSHKNILKANLREIFENDFKGFESERSTIDASSFKGKKDIEGNHYINFFCDDYRTFNNESTSEKITEYSNMEFKIMLDKNRKIINYEYMIISSKKINN